MVVDHDLGVCDITKLSKVSSEFIGAARCRQSTDEDFRPVSGGSKVVMVSVVMFRCGGQR